MDNLSYFSTLHQYLERYEAIWQAIIVACEGSTPARAGMHLAIPLAGDPFGNLGGGELEHSIIQMVRDKQPQGSQLLEYALAEDGTAAQLRTGMLCGGKVTVFLEALHHINKLYIIGAGHCGKALGHLAKLCGYYVCLVDNRPEVLKQDLSACSHELIYSDYHNLKEQISFGRENLLVIMTHGHLYDEEVLQQCLREPLKYLGMIGSRNKVAITFARLREQGCSNDELSRCHAPIGLAIGSQTPYEIAVSIMAEIICESKKAATPDWQSS